MRRLLRLRFYALGTTAFAFAIGHIVGGTLETALVIGVILCLVAGGVDLAGGLRGAAASVPPNAFGGTASSYVPPVHHHHGGNITPPMGGHGGGHH